MPTCACGHEDDEHGYAFGHYRDCGIEDCGCILYEPEGDYGRDEGEGRDA